MEQFQYCSFCKISHKQKKKHVYSKKHQQIINKILQKFSLKVKAAKVTLDKPEIQAVGYEHGAKFWCYFCVNDYDKHLLLDICTLKFGGLLEHISEDVHRTSVYKFLQEHRLEEEKQPASQFLLSQDFLKKFKEAAEVAIRHYEERKQQNLKMESDVIRMVENRRRMLSMEPQSERPGTSIRFNTNNQPRNLPNVQRKTTLSAHGVGLTFIGTQDLDDNEGNVHMEAPPPWLQTDEDKPSRSEIGPTIEDYNKHLEREKSRKLPPGRVGAKYDHSGSTSSHWLPSFGRVWNTGRRQQSEIFFRKEMGQSNSKDVVNKYDVMQDKVDSVPGSVDIKPYVKKRPVYNNGVSNNSPSPTPNNTNIHSYTKKSKMTEPVSNTGTVPYNWSLAGHPMTNTQDNGQHFIAEPVVMWNNSRPGMEKEPCHHTVDNGSVYGLHPRLAIFNQNTASGEMFVNSQGQSSNTSQYYSQ